MTAEPMKADGHNATTRYIYRAQTSSFSLSKSIRRRTRLPNRSLAGESCDKQTEQAITTTSSKGNQGSDGQDLICKPTSGQQRTGTNFMASAVVTRPTKQAPGSDRFDVDDLPQHHHDNNNNNSASNNDDNNGGNNGRVRPPIAPVAAERSCGSKQQQQFVGYELVKQQPLPARSHQLPSIGGATQNDRQKSYHHYDYYTESDLTGSLPPIAASKQTANHYEENILLFATEHNGGQNSNSNNNGPIAHKQAEKQRQVTKYLNGASHKQQLAAASLEAYGSRSAKQAANCSNQLLAPSLGQTGKFVNYYPSWRQSQSPTTGHQQNYSFHVPLHLQGSHRQPAGQQHYPARYGFVAPIGSRKQVALENPNSSVAGRSQRERLATFNRSRTISHLPNMVKISVEDTSINNSRAKNNLKPEESSNCHYEDFYDRPASSIGTRQFMRSDGDLLKAHLVTLRITDEGLDNPFKPGTELSWEADMMVRLMKRGYPVQELPVLVQTAKQVALDKESSKQLLIDESTQMAARRRPPARKSGPAKASTWSHKMTRSNSGERFEKRFTEEIDPGLILSDQQPLVRGRSSNDLSLGKQVWANSLSRTKSMPRFSEPTSDDADSIDKLITSIEQEMSELLKSEADKQQVGPEDASRLLPKEAIRGRVATSGSRLAAGLSNKQKRKSSDQKQHATSIKGRLRKSSNAAEASESNKADLIRRKTKQKDRGCCVIQ